MKTYSGPVRVRSVSMKTEMLLPLRKDRTRSRWTTLIRSWFSPLMTRTLRMSAPWDMSPWASEKAAVSASAVPAETAVMLRADTAATPATRCAADLKVFNVTPLD